MLLVSVIMSVFNETTNELNISINSILNQTYKNFELIIIDDNPKSMCLKKFLLNKSRKDYRIKLLFNSINIGASLSRNKGIKMSHGSLIAIMDADDISVKTRFYNQIKFLKKFNLDFVFSNCRPFNSDFIGNKIVCFNFNLTNQKILMYLFSHYYDFAVHSGWMLKKKIYKQLHGYRPLVDGEDFDFIIRSLTLGYRLGYQSKVLILKRRRKNNVSSKNNLKQFTISLVLKKYARKCRYNEVIPFNKIYNYQKNISSHSINKFNKFLFLGHNVKYNINIKYLIEFIFNVCTSLYAFEYLIDIVNKSRIRNKVVRMFH